MTLTAKQQAVLRAKKAIKAGHTNFKPRGRKNKKIFKQVLEGIDPNEEREPSPHRQLSELQASQDKEDDGDDLYNMRYSNDRTILKIVRSKNVEARRRQVQSGHNFVVETKAVFPSAGIWKGQFIIKSEIAVAKAALGVNGLLFHLKMQCV